MELAIICLAAAAVVWALAWWDVQRRKAGSNADIAALKNDVAEQADALGKVTKRFDTIEKQHREMERVVAAQPRPKLSGFQR